MIQHKIVREKHRLKSDAAEVPGSLPKNRLKRVPSGIAPTKPERFSDPPTTIGSVEDMETDPADLFHRPRPGRADVNGMIMSGRSHFREPYLASGDGHRDVTGHFPAISVTDPVPDRIAGERELASVSPVLVLVDNTTDGVRILSLIHI